MPQPNLECALANYRNRRLLDAIHEAPCCAVFPHQCSGTVIPAHSNEARFGRGYAYKSHDWAVAALCPEAHDYVDGKKGGWDKETKHAEWLRAYIKTQDWLWQTGRVKVAA